MYEVRQKILQQQIVWGDTWKFTQDISVTTVKSVEEDSTTWLTLELTKEHMKV